MDYFGHLSVQRGKIDSHNLKPFAMPTQINGDATHLAKVGSQSDLRVQSWEPIRSKGPKLGANRI